MTFVNTFFEKRAQQLLDLARGVEEDLIRLKLTSYRLRDQMHVKDLEDAGLITPEIEAALSPTLRERLAQVRARE